MPNDQARRRTGTAKRKTAKARAGAGARARKARPARRGAGRSARPPVKERAPRFRERRRHEPETLRLRSFAPSFTVGDLDRSVAFYTDVLGFVVKERWTEEGKVLGVMLKAGACELGLSQDDWAKGRDRLKGVGCRVSCETVQDVDALAARIKAAGGNLVEEPKDEWGSRSIQVDDPDGFHLTIYKDLPKGAAGS